MEIPMKHRKKRIPFCELSKTKRRKEWFNTRRDIEKDRDRFQGRFTSYYSLHEPGSPECTGGCGYDDVCVPGFQSCCQSHDFYFLGKQKYEVWSAEMQTACRDFWNTVDNMSFERAWAMLSPEEQAMDDKHEMDEHIPCCWDSNGKVLAYEVKSHPPLLFPQYGNLSFYDYSEQLEREIVAKEPPEIYESFEIDYSDPNGIGLRIILEVDVITVPLVIQTIDRFFEMGLKPWKSEKPVARERLPMQTETDYWRSLRGKLDTAKQ
jgi:hypothetical protein